jgi:hypothetical protein
MRSEKNIEDSLRAKLAQKGWVVEKNHGSLANFGRPDLHIAHAKYGEIWVEMKKPGGKLGAKQFAWMMKWQGVIRILVWENDDVTKFHRQILKGKSGIIQWQPWMTVRQRREARTGRTSLDDALEEFSA